MSNLNDKIQKLINENDICLFMKGTPESPQCGFSMTVSNILKHLNLKFKGINVLEDEELRQGIKNFSDWPTIPQLYVQKEFIGAWYCKRNVWKRKLKTLFEKKIWFKLNFFEKTYIRVLITHRKKFSL